MSIDYPEDLSYTKDHEWISKAHSETATIGVSSYAVEQLGDIVHIELPEPGESFDAGDSFGTIESTKTVSDLYMPVSGKISERNEVVLKNPEILQDDCYEAGWLVKIEVEPEADDAHLLTSDAYETYVAEQEDE